MDEAFTLRRWRYLSPARALLSLVDVDPGVARCALTPGYFV
jgi:hypothetical protein